MPSASTRNIRVRGRDSSRWWMNGLAVLLLMAGAFWAGRVTMAPPQIGTPVATEAVLTEVVDASVGRSFTWATQVVQEREPVAINTLAGVVTEAKASGTFDVGDVLYRVANAPVRVIQGPAAFYRDLGPGARGADVRQLNDALVSLGLLGSTNDQYSSATARAVRAWQKQLGVAQTGLVPLGEVVSVPSLPTNLAIDSEKVRQSAVLAGGEGVVTLPSGEPQFSMVVTSEQERMAPSTSQIVVHHEGHDWPAVVAEVGRDASGQAKWILSAPAGGVVCADQCGSLPAAEELSLLADVMVSAPVTGPGVPVAAITTKPDGSTVVLVADAGQERTERPVTVLGSQDGIAVVEGLSVGERVQVIAQPPQR